MVLTWELEESSIVCDPPHQTPCQLFSYSHGKRTIVFIQTISITSFHPLMDRACLRQPNAESFGRCCSPRRTTRTNSLRVVSADTPHGVHISLSAIENKTNYSNNDNNNNHPEPRHDPGRGKSCTSSSVYRGSLACHSRGLGTKWAGRRRKRGSHRFSFVCNNTIPVSCGGRG
ncbi:hypothetical protein BJX96DRAFT_130874 [Aspergillus floccosus]